MQLDRVPPSARRISIDLGIREGTGGVEHQAETSDGSRAERAHGSARRVSWRGFWAIVLFAIVLVGQGERYRIDTRLTSPERAIANFWRALRRDDDVGAAQCMVEGEHSLPFPGMLWFLPPTRDFKLSNFRSVPIEGGRVLVTYVVRYTPVGLESEQAFVTSFEMVRQRGEWRIVRPVGEASMPEWKPILRAVDI
ncbi:MAG: hypothetical protein ACRDL7_13470 [Gaiellaceae bacterium]